MEKDVRTWSIFEKTEAVGLIQVSRYETKIWRFVIYPVVMTSLLFICFRLLDLFEGTTTEKILKDTILSVTTGVMTSASLTLWPKSAGQKGK